MENQSIIFESKYTFKITIAIVWRNETYETGKCDSLALVRILVWIRTSIGRCDLITIYRDEMPLDWSLARKFRKIFPLPLPP